jgi:hypothetical protein
MTCSHCEETKEFRAEFEAWFATLRTEYVVAWREEVCMYSSQYLQLAWRAWKEQQARIEDLKVQLSEESYALSEQFSHSQMLELRVQELTK